MAKVKVKYFNPYNWAGIKTYIDSMNCPLVVNTEVVGDSLVITLEDMGTFTIYRSDGWFYLKYNFINDITRVAECWAAGSSVYPLLLCTSDNLFYFHLKGQWSWDIPNSYVFIYDKLSDNSHLVGSTTWRNAAYFLPVESLSLTELETVSTYAVGKPLNYAKAANHIDYCSPAILMSGDVKAYNDPNFTSCSTVTVNNVYTFNGQNYFAIGTNTLIPIDSNS